MEERSDQGQLRYSLHDLAAACYDEESDGENDTCDTEEHGLFAEDASEDSDFEIGDKHILEEAEMKEEEEEEDKDEVEDEDGRSSRHHGTIKSRNNFLWSANPQLSSTSSANTGKTQDSDPPITYSPSAKEEAKTVKTPMEAWSLLFTEEMLQSIILYTNAEMERQRKSFSDQIYYRDTNLCELRAFLGLLYLGGLEKHNHRNTDELWNPFCSGCSIYRCVMSEHRFRFFLTCLRFDDRLTRKERMQRHPLAPIKDLWEEFIGNCSKYYSPSTNCTVDVQLLGFRGHFKARVYVASKPEKYGIKIVSCNDAETSYMTNAEIYVGNPTNQDDLPAYYATKLTKPIWNTHRVVTCDKWFVSLDLAKRMKEEYSLRMVGTIKKNAPEVPKHLTKTASPGTTRYAFAEGMTLLGYSARRNKVILLLSSLHESPRMDQENGKPEIISFYNKTRAGTERFEQTCRNYTTSRMTRRWSMRIFYGMLDQASVNANILFNMGAGNKILSRRFFLQQLVSAMIKPFLAVRLQMTNLRSNIRYTIREILDVQPQSTGNRSDKLQKRKRCSMCPSQIDRKTLYCCAECKAAVCEEHRTHYCKRCAM